MRGAGAAPVDAPPAPGDLLTGPGQTLYSGVCLEQPELMRRTSPVRQPHRLPVVPSVEEVAQILANAPGLKYQTAFSIAYGAGLRAGEVVALKIADIDKRLSLPPPCAMTSPRTCSKAVSTSVSSKICSGMPSWRRTCGSLRWSAVSNETSRKLDTLQVASAHPW